MPDDEFQKELICDLIIESSEGLDQYDDELLEFEKDKDTTRLNLIFRVIHTIKGTAGCLGLTKIEKVAHVGENLLSLLREKKLIANSERITALFSLSDALKEMLHTLETTSSEGDKDYKLLITSLNTLLEETSEPEQIEEAEVMDSSAFGLFEEEEAQADENAKPASGVTAIENDTEPDPEKPKQPISGGSIADGSIRVGVDHLNKMMNMVGELVLARNQIIVNSANYDANALQKATQRLNLITTELQESVMKTRMQPIGTVWGKFPRVVRDVSAELGKQIKLILEGKETELDRTIIEAIKDPLTHIIRNSVDHGIESPERREAAGKSREGMIALRAYHEGGQVIIEVMDDGAGIDVQKVKSKAVEKSLITSSQAAKMSEREALNLIFLPGFSTAGIISNVSGRGVGMDVVKTNIEKIGGTIDLQSQTGQGTNLNIKIPLTLAIVPALIVNSQHERYAIPQVSLLELVRLEGEQATSEIEYLHGSPFYRLRGTLLPIVYLDEQLKTRENPATDGPRRDPVLSIIVVQADGRPFGIVVDEIQDTEEIVVKPLGRQLRSLACFAGSTIMGDGSIALIIDVLSLAQHAGVVTNSDKRSRLAENEAKSASDGTKESLLLFTINQNHRMALPLSLAARLEEIPADRIETTGNLQVVQYRGQILPLIRVADYLQLRDAPGDQQVGRSDSLQVIVYTENEKSIGLVVDSINDIVDEEIVAHHKSPARGIMSSAVIQQRVIDLLDAPQIIRAADPDFYANAS